MARRPHLTPTLVTKFAVLSAVAFAALGFVLSQSISNRVTEQHLQSATDAAELVAGLGVKPLFAPDDFAGGLTDLEIAKVDRQLRTGQLRDKVVRIKVWSIDSRVIYSDDKALIGRNFPTKSDLAAALRGEVESDVTDLSAEEQASERSYGQLLEVYVPIRFVNNEPPVGAFELYLPYLSIERGIKSDLRALQLRLVGGLLLLYVVLYRIVSQASSKLRNQSNELRLRADENEFIAMHDGLTGLPNRNLFLERIKSGIDEARRNDSSLAVMILDLDRFREVNDTLGHQSGDELLKAIATRLREVVRDYDSIARLGGDEFGVLMRDVRSSEDALDIARQIRRALSAPFFLEGLWLDVSAGSGLALAPEHGKTADELLKRADVAMYLSKENDEHVALYDPLQDRNSPERLVLVGELRSAIEQNQLSLRFQPKVDLRTRRMVGVEALARWDHPQHGPISPETFVEIAEQTGLIKPLTYWVLDAAMAQAGEWRAAGLKITTAVNLSVRNLIDAALPEDVQRAIDRWDMSPEDLTFEITESAMMMDPARTREVLKKLDGMGIKLAVDDFGTGHSSLAYLKQLPVKELKIDRSFVIDMDDEESAGVIVRSTIDLAHNLGMTVVAEGVEKESSAEYLAILGCEVAQGYLFSPALTADGVAVMAAQGPKTAGLQPAAVSA